MLKDVRRIYDENGKVELEFDPPVSVYEAIGRKQLKREAATSPKPSHR